MNPTGDRYERAGFEGRSDVGVVSSSLAARCDDGLSSFSYLSLRNFDGGTGESMDASFDFGVTVTV